MTRAYAVGGLLLRAVGGLILGVAVAVAAVALHGLWWGLLLGVAAGLAAAVALPRGGTRVGYAVGWLAVVARAAVPRPAGSFLVGGNLPGYVMLGLALALLVLGVGTLQPRRREPAEGPRGTTG